MQIVEHRIAGVRQVASPNCNARPAGEVSLIVVHGISLPAGVFGGTQVEQLFCNSLDTSDPQMADLKDVEVSSHIFIRRDGEILQFVPFDMRAWHAGESRLHGRTDCNDFSVGIELEGTDTQAYEAAQYASLARVCRALMQHYGVLEIVGHSHIAPGRKTDPGPAFNWARLRSLLAKQL